MRIVTLLENSKVSSEFKAKHGISLYVETEKQKILFDSGPDSSFLKNAYKLNVDLSAVDFMILSHGHYDHGGGLATFLKHNSRARIIMKNTATNRFFVKKFALLKISIGLKLNRIDKSRLELIPGHLELDESLVIHTDFQKDGFIPAGNASLMTEDANGNDIVDPFDHEICLLIKEKNKHVLFTGCSHSGLGNMMRSVKKQASIDNIDTVFGGFHLYNPITRKTESKEQINNLLKELSEFPETVFYTGHCTGNKAFEYLQSETKGRVLPFKTGMDLTI